MQFPILPPPRISPVAALPSASVDGSALPAFADVLAALRGAPAVAKDGSGEPVAAPVRDMGEPPGPAAGETVAPPAGAVPMANEGVKPRVADLPDPAPDHGEDPDLTGREAGVLTSIPLMAAPASPAAGDPPAPAVQTRPVALPERSVPAALPEAPRAGLLQVPLAIEGGKPAQHAAIPLSWALPEVAVPAAGEGRVTHSAPPAPQMPPVPATPVSAVAPVPVAPSLSPPSPSSPADPIAGGGEAVPLRSDTGLVSGPAPAPAEGPRPGMAAPLAPITPQGVAAQIAVALGRSADGTIDIALHPQELGRLRLSLTPTDAGLVVTIAAERPETLDLLRRHAVDLGQDLRNLGFRDVDLNFGAPGSDHFRGHRAPGPTEDADIGLTTRSAQVPSPVAPVLPGVGGLDIRL